MIGYAIAYWKYDNDKNTHKWCPLCSDFEPMAGTCRLRNNLRKGKLRNNGPRNTRRYPPYSLLLDATAYWNFIKKI